jgi:hypothetical protein
METTLEERDTEKAGSPTVNWVLALLTLPAAGAVVAYAFLQVLGTAACSDRTSCPRLGPGEIGFTLIIYGAPAVAVLAVLLSFVTARKPRGVLVPVIAFGLLIVAAVVLFLTFP